MFDAITMTAVAAELASRICGGRIQKILSPDELSVALEVYAGGERYYVLASAHPESARVHLLADKPRRGPEVQSPLLLLLRRCAEGGRVESVQAVPYERVLEIAIRHGDQIVRLIVEVMGRHSNIVLVDAEGLILESVKRVGPHQSRYRLVLPRHRYLPPPPQAKLSLEDLTSEHIQALLPPGVDPAAALVSGVRGVSPLLARETVARAGSGGASSEGEAIVAALRDLWSEVRSGRVFASVGLDGERVMDYAPYRLLQFEAFREVSGISAAIGEYMGRQTGVDAYARARADIAQEVEAAEESVRRRRESLERALAQDSASDGLRTAGELILANTWRITARQVSLVATDSLGGSVDIPLDPSFTAVENAQSYFKRYHKAKAATREVPELLEQADADAAYLAQLRADLELAEDRASIDEVHRALLETGWVRGERPKSASPKSGPLVAKSADGRTILVGRNARQNELVTFERAGPADAWLHARGVSGAHVIVKAGGEPISDETLREAAALAAYYSSSRHDAAVDVDWTERRNVRRNPGGTPGMVHYTGERTLRVRPHPVGNDQETTRP
jgi:predicted ribosome quality control (RQC) complex YloA/Tae2 family protein